MILRNIMAIYSHLSKMTRPHVISKLLGNVDSVSALDTLQIGRTVYIIVHTVEARRVCTLITFMCHVF